MIRKAGKLAPWKYGSSDFRPEFAEQAGKLSALAATDCELADFFNVDLSTFRRWQLEYPEFREAIGNGWAMAMRNGAADDRVERAFHASLLARRRTKIV
jgi:hypothetical protein